MEKLNIQIIFLMAVILVIILSLVFAFLFCWPKYLELKDLQSSVKAKQQEIKYQKEYFAELSQIKNELKNYETDIAKIDSALPDDSSVPALLSFIQTAVPQSGLILKGISPFSAVSSLTDPNIKEIQLSFVLDGSYPALKNFLSVLEKSARFIEVENISFSSSKDAKIFSFNVKIKTFSY